ncbi:MAG: ABC transporter permease [Pyrinomonadaceae bacterium]|nr:ABC transporter permease [Pyrinomonadaceae bacterium]
MGILWQDLRYGLRMLFKNPGFTAVAVLALALGIGANTAIFSVVNAVLLRPLPYKDADRLVVTNLSLPDYHDVERGNGVFDGMAVYASNLYNLIGTDGSEQVLGAIVSPDFFPLLGTPSLGRTFSAAETGESLAVISHDLWQRRFGGDAGALGKTLNLGGRPHTVVGVMPPEFQFPDSGFKLWVTMGSAMAATPEQTENRSLRIFRVIAHLKSGVSLTQAQADVDRIANLLEQQYPDTNQGVSIRFVSLYERMVGPVRPALLVLLGTVGFILLMACANVANLLLARTATREREIAIRAALGAGRWRVARQLLTESVLLSSLSGALGVVLAAWGIDLLPHLGAGDIPRASSIRIDLPVLFFTLGASLLTGILFGLAPALQAAKINLNESLKEGGRGGAGGTRGRRLRGALVVTEVALSMVVLIGAGLLIKSFTRLLKADAGFVTENLLTMNIEMSRYKEPQKRAALASQVVEQIEQIPGVQAVGGGTGLPPQTAQRGTSFEVEGLSALDPSVRSAYFLAITPHYFRALGTPLIGGRSFNERDIETAPKVVIINRSLARRLFPTEDPVGRRIKLVNPDQQPDWRMIVGVVGDIKYAGLDDPGEAAIYTPFAQTPFYWTYVMVRTTSSPLSVSTAIQKAVSSVDQNLIAARIQPMEQLISASVAQPRFNALLLSIFAGLALVLAAVGIYGVVSYGVAERTREIGIRMALGAREADVLKLVVGQGVVLSIIGVSLGLIGAVAVTRVTTSLLYGVSATDPATFLMVSLLLIGVAALASFIPARRATKVDPMIALRYE